MWTPLQLQIPPPPATALLPQNFTSVPPLQVQLHQQQQGNGDVAHPQQQRAPRPQPMNTNSARRPHRSSTAPQRPSGPPRSAPPTQTTPPVNMFSQSTTTPSANLEYGISNIYVMMNTDDVPKKLESVVDIFYLFDGVRYIVGYCLPLKCYMEYFGNAPPCRVIKAIENVELYQEHIHRFKFQIAPLNVVPVNEVDFYEMISSTQTEMENGCDVLRNRFYMRPSILRPPNEVMRSADNTATQSVVSKFQLNTNPHLIPIRLPDGLECYIRLNLAKHCQEVYCSDEVEFGYYHFREVQRDANMRVPASTHRGAPQSQQYHNRHQQTPHSGVIYPNHQQHHNRQQQPPPPQQQYHHYQQRTQHAVTMSQTTPHHHQRHIPLQNQPPTPQQYGSLRHNHNQPPPRPNHQPIQPHYHSQSQALALLTSTPPPPLTIAAGGGGTMTLLALPALPFPLPPMRRK